ncbi:MAG: sulfatase [Halanaerobiales bacterium]
MKPNILYIHSHDTGRYIEPYGHSVSTPNLTELAKEGVLFRKAFSTAPTCSPSRASFLTGQYPHNNGQYGLVNRGFELPHTNKHLANVLRENGYKSTLIGMQHIRRDPTTIGYDEVIEVKDNYSKYVTPSTVEFINKNIETPFFLSVGFQETHRPFHEIENEDDIKYTQPPSPLPDTPRTRKDMAAFKESANVLDRGIGKILNTLKEKSLYDNTIIIFTTDHGLPFPDMKCTLKDDGIGVSLIIRGQQGLNSGKVIDSMVSQIDVYPTICQLVGIEEPDWLQGKSILPLIKGNKDFINENIYAEVNFHTAYEPMRAVRTKRWKYIRRFRNRTKPFLSNIDQSLSKDVWLENGWDNTYIQNEELYDLILDSNESNNLAAETSHKDVLEEMRNKLDNWMIRTEDPIKKGEIPVVDDALINKDSDRAADDIWNYIDKQEGYY